MTRRKKKPLRRVLRQLRVAKENHQKLKPQKVELTMKNEHDEAIAIGYWLLNALVCS
jgi:hypothetical protein